ncbi:MAG: type II secretion system protein GspN [Syntrophus sp. (in: bacteria)]|nr:type II secretion system protein GspN [Syntrophus sp. (in: bacteria)]MBA4418989.1 type II secretion system protein GspN [Syntrophus sp. (in: bacteria)]
MTLDIGYLKLKIGDIYKKKIAGLDMKKYLLYAGAVVWFFLLLIVLMYFFFPYQKLFRIALQNLFCGNKMTVSIEGAKIKHGGGIVSKIVFGHEALKEKPLFEIEKIKVRWNPFSLVKGTLNISSDASMYRGTMKVNIDRIPVIINSVPLLKINFANVDLAGHPEDTLPWFKGMSGTLNGWIKNESPLYTLDKQKGSFSINMKDGEIKEILIRDFPRLTIPYKEIVIEGKIEGERINLSRIVINSPGNTIRGSGIIDANQYEQKVDFKLYYEALVKNAPLAGKGTITITGKQWSPDIIMTPEVPEKPAEAAAPAQKK